MLRGRPPARNLYWILQTTRTAVASLHPPRILVAGLSNGCSLQSLLLTPQLMFVSRYSMFVCPYLKGYNSASASIPAAKRKEEWLIEKLRKFEIPKAPAPVHDPESLTEEERFYLRRTGEKKKNYCPVGRRGVFGGVVLNMHLHWKKHETVKVICKPCRPGQVHEYAEELARLSKGIVIDIKANTILFYRGKNYVRPEVMSPIDTLSKDKALEKYRFEQSLEHTSQFIEKLENDLEEYQKHVARYREIEDNATSQHDS